MVRPMYGSHEKKKKMNNKILSSKKDKAVQLIKKFDDKAIDVVQEIIEYVTDGEPDYTGKTIWLQELQNEISFIQYEITNNGLII